MLQLMNGKVIGIRPCTIETDDRDIKGYMLQLALPYPADSNGEGAAAGSCFIRDNAFDKAQIALESTVCVVRDRGKYKLVDM